MIKRKWKKPQLIVLLRPKDEALVLTACKGSGAGHKSSDYENPNCDRLVENACSTGCQLNSSS